MSEEGEAEKAKHEDDPGKIFEILEKLGHGTFGTVYKARELDSQEIVALKVINVNDDEEGSVSKLLSEISILHECDSPYVTSFRSSHVIKDKLYISMEFCDLGSLGSVLKQLDRLGIDSLKEDEIRIICRQVLEGLDYLHNKKVMHRDLKADNILFKSTGQIKLADFGVASQMRSTIDKKRTAIGSPYWMAPELILEQRYDSRVDIWSLGITAIELAQRRPPHFELLPMRALFLIATNPSPTLEHPEKWSEQFNSFIGCCLQRNPEQRPTAAQLLTHPFVKDVTDNEPLKRLSQRILEARERLGKTGSAIRRRPGGERTNSNSKLLQLLAGQPNPAAGGRHRRTNSLQIDEGSSSETSPSQSPTSTLSGSPLSSASPMSTSSDVHLSRSKKKQLFARTASLSVLGTTDDDDDDDDDDRGGSSTGDSDKVKVSHDWSDKQIIKIDVVEGDNDPATDASTSGDKPKLNRTHSVRLVPAAKPPSIEKIEELVAMMRDPVTGVEVRDRRKYLKTYKRCFTGKKAVTWLVDHLNLGQRADAVAVGQILMYRGIIHHVGHSQPFLDKNHFYRFFEDELEVRKEKDAERSRKRTMVSTAPVTLSTSAPTSPEPTVGSLASLLLEGPHGSEAVRSLLKSLNEEKITGLIKAMANLKTGLKVDRRKDGLRSHDLCFVGSDAVEWLMKHFQLTTREESFIVAQTLMERGVFRSVTGEERFFDDNRKLYRLFAHEKGFEEIAVTSPRDLAREPSDTGSADRSPEKKETRRKSGDKKV